MVAVSIPFPTRSDQRSFQDPLIFLWRSLKTAVWRRATRCRISRFYSESRDRSNSGEASLFRTEKFWSLSEYSSVEFASTQVHSSLAANFIWRNSRKYWACKLSAVLTSSFPSLPIQFQAEFSERERVSSLRNFFHRGNSISPLFRPGWFRASSKEKEVMCSENICWNQRLSASSILDFIGIICSNYAHVGWPVKKNTWCLRSQLSAQRACWSPSAHHSVICHSRNSSMMMQPSPQGGISLLALPNTLTGRNVRRDGKCARRSEKKPETEITAALHVHLPEFAWFACDEYLFPRMSSNEEVNLLMNFAWEEIKKTTLRTIIWISSLSCFSIHFVVCQASWSRI